ncbi:MAG: adenylate/guanylate cyclase domain-containing protein [Bradyrhizobium sp.]|uniref:adenylate/guanylate cyclase domain-containing protein n=1 Tax=Bradyrhizobium sp. TaxID=376 RepID=UPI001C290A60|nr:adenylate/guanylate cyclase domain-containing protein [Bradyrhizobium sp.]MBU6463725.1 adenylate/guanylate cyclase domain-containing protein [Pseudomonadota bacterium]MDE2065908.1 adenylate/guanylate cyclase domain-containing protein [Bradyrhizobium sp.]MDE2242418.1 adenylate/guanylate cyclase domain-containing protein [Bradyrhizobium sp.]MDE2471175.1 adenylate/guanylate cyclase domain-containing protein [Bradyrhizobium sp.]
MKRKIAAIFAADIAGYSRLVAEDEEETLRRLASYRCVIDDFIARAGGRIFNTAGDAVLAEFSSAVEAVRCAIDIQESLRTRNMAYPPSRHMSFRIGITIGDVVERDGDLLGDGVNIAARLEGLAEVGGICISRAVHEQVANKLSVQFADIGAQEVKNIPTPVHAYMVAMRREDGTYATPQVKKPAKLAPAAAAPNWMWPVAVAVVCLAAIGVIGFLYFTGLELRDKGRDAVQASNAAPVTMPTPAAPSVASPPVMPATAAAVTASPGSSPALPTGEQFSPEAVPFVLDRIRAVLANEYIAAAEPKALALNQNGMIGMVSDQPNEEVAKSAALEQCQKRADAVGSPRKCEIYAVGGTVVYPHGRPPLPPLPWFKRDPSIEKPFTPEAMPFMRDRAKARLENVYMPGKKSKAIAIDPAGHDIFYTDGASVAEVVRRALETCGAVAGAPCKIVAVDDVFVVPVPTTMKAVGMFRPADDPAIATDARADVVHELAEASTGWNAVAVGSSGRPGMAAKAASEQDAVNGALANCAKRDSNCHIIAIGPYAVSSN